MERKYRSNSSRNNVPSIKTHRVSFKTRHQPKRRYRCLKQSKKQWVTHADQRQKRVQSTLIEFGQINPSFHNSESNVDQEKITSTDPNALIKSVVNDRVKSNRFVFVGFSMFSSLVESRHTNRS